MKHAKKRHTGKITAIVVVSIVLVLIIGFLIYLAVRGNDAPSTTGSAQEQSEPVGEGGAAETQDDDTNAPDDTSSQAVDCCVAIDTPYLTLYYDEAFSDNMEVVNSSRDPFVLEFYALLEGKPEQRLFDLYMGEGADGNLGRMKTDYGMVPVGMTIYVFQPDDTWNKDEINTILAMQEVANEIIEQLPLDQTQGNGAGAVISEKIPASNLVEYMAIETPYCVLKYPAVWKDFVLVEQNRGETYQVQFYGNLENRDAKLLFTILFGGDVGEQLGVVRTEEGQMVTVNLLIADLDLTDWSEEDKTLIYEMQEAVNLLIAQLPLE